MNTPPPHPALTKMPTGIKGFDEITNGGIPATLRESLSAPMMQRVSLALALLSDRVAVIRLLGRQIVLLMRDRQLMFWNVGFFLIGGKEPLA